MENPEITEVRLVIMVESLEAMEVQVHSVIMETLAKATTLAEIMARIATVQTTLVDHVPVPHEQQ